MNLPLLIRGLIISLLANELLVTLLTLGRAILSVNIVSTIEKDRNAALVKQNLYISVSLLFTHWIIAFLYA